MGDSVSKYYELVSEEEFDKLVENDKADLGASLEKQAKHTNWEEEYMDVITHFEKEYPELSSEFKLIQKEMYNMFARKHMDYGLNNIALGGDLTNAEDKKFSLTGLAIRLTDKISRLKNLLINGKNFVEGEGMEDTFIDIANYGIIGLLVGRDKWKK
tara:strand:+ start:24 stop:494 length:471 start_codon:yes stop_codon:yes gene_type:complete